ncbi:hypothetical protein [Nocardia sp. NPDC057440]|uniref:hypothetical protein n=1 Tax=Nocardia sp. NPDC057440 TaxID=3346134 RepID=UPI00366CC6CD
MITVARIGASYAGSRFPADVPTTLMAARAEVASSGRISSRADLDHLWRAVS